MNCLAVKLIIFFSALGEFRCPECRHPFWRKDLHIHHEIDQIINLCEDVLPKFEADFNHTNPRDCSEDILKQSSLKEENAPLFHTPPDNDQDDPDSFVTASNESPKQPVQNTDLQHSGIAGSSCRTLNLDHQPEEYSNLNSIFDDSNDDADDLPVFDLNLEIKSGSELHSIIDAGKAKDMHKVSLPTTPVENVSQKSCHVKPVGRTYSMRNRHKCPKVPVHNVVDDDSQISNWLQNSVLFEETDNVLGPGNNQKSKARRTSKSSSSTKIDELIMDSDKGSKVPTKKLERKDDFKGSMSTRSKRSSSSSIKSDVPKTPVIKRKSSENKAKPKRVKTSPATIPLSEIRTPQAIIKTPRSKQTAARTPKTPTTTPRNKRNQKGETLLHKAAITGDFEKLKSLLVENEIDVNSKDNAGWTPLHEACIKRHVDCARLLLKHGAQINAKAENLDTPLHDACAKDAVDIIELLLENGACKILKNLDGYTPVDCAQSDKALQLLDKATNAQNLSVLDENHPSEESMGDVVIAFSGVPNAKFGKYQKMKGLTFKTVEEVTNQVTHLVCAVDENSCCKRTIKFMKAMALGVVIVSVRWLDECAKSSSWINPLAYVVKGALNSAKDAPLKSFSDQKNGVPRLFTGLTFFIDSKNNTKNLSKDVISDLIQSANGKLLSRAPKETALKKTKVYHAEKDSILHPQSTIIISEIQTSTELLVKSTKWIMDCISSYTLIEQ